MEQSAQTQPSTTLSQKPFENRWSWAGFMMEHVLIIAAKRYWLLPLYLLMFIPILNILVIAAMKIYFGLKGREFVKNSNAFSNEDEYRGFIKGVDHVGITLFFIGGIALIIGIIVVVLGVSGFFGGESF